MAYAILLAAGIIVASVLFAIGGVWLGRRLMLRHVAGSHNEVVISLFATASVVYAVLLGFLVVAVWQAYDDAHRNVEQEAASLVSIYRLTYGMEAQHGADARKIIRAYADAVVNHEWGMLGRNAAGSPHARKAIGALDRQFAHLSIATKQADAEVDAEFLRIKSAIVADRNERLLERTDTLPWVMWLGAIGGGAIVMVMSFLIFTERVWPHMLMASLVSSLIGLLLFILLVLSQPFVGPLAVTKAHFRSALQVMDDVDKGY